MILGTGLRTYRVYEWPTSTPVPDTGAFDIRPITAANADDVLSFRDRELATTFRRFLDEARVGVFAYVDGRAVAHAWITPVAVRGETANGYFRLAPGDALIHYCHVAPDMRGRGLFGATIRRLTADTLAAHPDGRVLIDTGSDNRASQRGIVKAGFEALGDRHVVRVAGRTALAWTRLGSA